MRLGGQITYWTSYCPEDHRVGVLRSIEGFVGQGSPSGIDRGLAIALGYVTAVDGGESRTYAPE